MYLVDTSIWVDYFKGRESAAIKYFTRLLEDKTPYGITGVIYQEVLQGAASQQDFAKLAEYLCTLRFYQPKDLILSYERAAGLYFYCRRKGVTLRSTIDCLIAQIAIENELLLLHKDKDFDRIAGVVPELKIAT